MSVFLLTDIGGTHVRFSVYDGEKASKPERYATQDFLTFEDAVRHYMQTKDVVLSGMVIGAAGMRQNNCVRLTNCPWVINTETLQTQFRLNRVILLNDFALQGLGVLHCETSDYILIGETETLPIGPKAIIGAGTGLGVCFLTSDTNNRYQVFESEGGHSTVGGVSPIMRMIIQKANEKLPHVSYERFISGPGLMFLYQIMGENYQEWSHHLLSDEIMNMQRAWSFVPISSENDKWQAVSTPPEITQLAEQGNEIALMTWWLFFEFLGVFCADMALTLKTTGGVYLVGDLLKQPFIAKMLQRSYLRKMFETKGRFSKFTKQIPLMLVTKNDIPLCGLTHIAKNVWK